jgi:hypothetical protein
MCEDAIGICGPFPCDTTVTTVTCSNDLPSIPVVGDINFLQDLFKKNQRPQIKKLVNPTI